MKKRVRIDVRIVDHQRLNFGEQVLTLRKWARITEQPLNHRSIEGQCALAKRVKIQPCQSIQTSNGSGLLCLLSWWLLQRLAEHVPDQIGMVAGHYHLL